MIPNNYKISRRLFNRIITVLEHYQFETVDENEGGVDEINNDEVIELIETLRSLDKREKAKLVKQ